MPPTSYAYQVVQPELNRNVEMILNDPSNFQLMKNCIPVRKSMSKESHSFIYPQRGLSIRAILMIRNYPMDLELPSLQMTLIMRVSLRMVTPMMTRLSLSSQMAGITKAKLRILP